MVEIMRVFKYAIVGITGTLIDVVALFILVQFFHFSVLSAVTISFVLAATNNFIWNKFWTFNNRNANYHHQYLKFLIVSIIGLMITLLFMFIFHIIAGIWYIFAKLITSLLVLYWNYWGNKNWTFRPAEKEIFEKEFFFDYSIIIPAYNEEKRIVKNLESIVKFLEVFPHKCEIIVIDDGSKDKTIEIVNNFAKKISKTNDPKIKVVEQRKNHGKGYAVKVGVEHATGKYILFTDADGSTPINELEKMAKYIGDYDLVIGSRKMMDSVLEKTQPFYRRMISKIGAVFSKIIINNIKDTQCGFKLMKNEAAKFIFEKQKIKRFGFDLEILAIAQHYDFKIIEIPVTWSDDKQSKFRPIRDTIITFRDFIVIQYNFLTNKY